MDIYLPIAGLSVNALVIIGLGGLVGLLTGMVGVGGGFLTTPILIFFGIPTPVAVASATTQITGTSVSGVFAHRRRKGVDYRMGAVIIVGGLIGALAGGMMFRLLQQSGQIDTVIAMLYVLLLGGIGILMARESATALGFVALIAVLLEDGLAKAPVIAAQLKRIGITMEIENGTGSDASYGCRNGDLFIEGTLSGTSVTFAAQNYIYVTGDIRYKTGEPDTKLGLIGTNAVWVWNPMTSGGTPLIFPWSNRDRRIDGAGAEAHHRPLAPVVRQAIPLLHDAEHRPGIRRPRPRQGHRRGRRRVPPPWNRAQ